MVSKNKFLKIILNQIDASWFDFFGMEMKKPYFGKLLAFLEKEYQEQEIYPCKEQLFNCFKLTSLNNLKVIILGQDPYHTKGVADGLAFSSQATKIPPSLKNIFKELNNDLGINNNTPNLKVWAEQGVLLLNTILSVRQGMPLSHQNQGWEEFSKNLIIYLNHHGKYIYVLWGNNAKKYQKIISNGFVITGAHPSPFSARLFLNKNYFSQINELLIKQGKTAIDWRLENEI